MSFAWRRETLAWLAVAAMLLAAAVGLLAARPAEAASCPTAPASQSLPSRARLERQSKFLEGLGARPTGSLAQRRYIRWIRNHLARLHGIKTRDIGFPIKRWTERRTTLSATIGGKTMRVPIAAPIPYSAPTSRHGVQAPLAFVPDDEPISAANAAGKIVVRPAPAGAVPNAGLLLPVIAWESYDPGDTIDPSGTFYGDFINYNARVADLRDAATAGAKGVLFVKDEPRRQLRGHYEPYEGTVWGVPGAFLGVDEGQRLIDAIRTGGGASGRIVVRAHTKRMVTHTVIASVPGRSKQRIVIDSHTDGINAVEDNGPIAMVAMARYLTRLPRSCRPRTVEFAFSTAHFYQRVGADKSIRDGGAEQLAQRLDAAYDRGTVSAVLVLEHLGALDYEAVPRGGGKPGDKLEPNGERAIQFIGVTPSTDLLAAVDRVVRTYDMRRTLLLQGSDLPGTTVPSHCSFGGEGTPYERHLLPTIGVITAPQWLYDPAFGTEAIDFGVMRSELRGFTDLVNRLGLMKQSAIAGTVPDERRQRALGAPSCPPAN